jgi:ankyrin repeat protein
MFRTRRTRVVKAIWAICLAVFAASFPAGAQENHQKFYSAIRADDLEGLKALLDQGLSADTPDSRGITPLMYAAQIGSADAMRLLIARGAAVNAQNAFGSTALMWSVFDPEKARLLLDHEADVKLAAKSGRTALIIAAFANPSAEVVRMLLAKGASAADIDHRKVTTLNAATFGNDTAAIRLLVEAGADINTPDVFIGLTPLMNSAGHGNLAAVQLLLAKGAKVNAVSMRENLPRIKTGLVAFGGFTPLLMATPFGPPEVVKTLLDAGAEVNVADIRGMTPLMLAIATDRFNPSIVKMLLAAGADTTPKSLEGETALDWARKMGAAGIIETLGGGARKPAVRTVSVTADPPDIRTAVERSVRLLERTQSEFFTKSACFACHAQVSADFAAEGARSKGIAPDEKFAAERRLQITGSLGVLSPALTEGPSALGGADNNLYAMEPLVRSGYGPNRVTDFLVANIASQQSADGSWRLPGYSRAPLQDSNFSRTAMAIRGLKVYATPGRATEMKQRIERAGQWLERAEPVILEDRDMRLLGLAAAGASASKLKTLAEPILANQRPDGGWAQRDEFPSDAYATGMTLWALAEAGVIQSSQPVYQKGVKFLLSTQRADGSWRVTSRAAKFQEYFETSFPYGGDQWISAMGTGWASSALARAIDTPKSSPVARALTR